MYFIKQVIKQLLFRFSIQLFKPRKTSSREIGICSVLCHEFVDMYVYCIMSFYYHAGRVLPLYVINDGSLTKEDVKKLRYLFSIIIEQPEQSTHRMSQLISKKKYPNFATYRFTNQHYSRYKFDALMLCPYEKMICFDSDVLFFRSPETILNWMRSTKEEYLYMNHDWSVYEDTHDADVEHVIRMLIKLLQHPAYVPTCNVGLLCMPNKKVFDLQKLDSIFLLFHTVTYDRISTADEVALGLLITGQKNVHPLTKETYVVAVKYENYGNRIHERNLVAMHYALMKKYFVSDAVKQMFKTRLFGHM